MINIYFTVNIKKPSVSDTRVSSIVDSFLGGGKPTGSGRKKDIFNCVYYTYLRWGHLARCVIEKIFLRMELQHYDCIDYEKQSCILN